MLRLWRTRPWGEGPQVEPSEFVLVEVARGLKQTKELTVEGNRNVVDDCGGGGWIIRGGTANGIDVDIVSVVERAEGPHDVDDVRSRRRWVGEGV